MAILEATLTTEFVGQLCINRWHYISSGDPGSVTPSFALANAMGFVPPAGTPWKFDADGLAGYIQHLTSNNLVFRAFYVRNLYTPTDFFETAFNASTTGDQTGELASPLLAYGVQSNRVRTDIRRGSKRFSGVTESNMNNGGLIAGDAVGFLGGVASLMSNVLTYDDDGASLSLAPAILKFQEYTTPRGKKAYKKQDTEALQLAAAATGISYTALDRVRSQTSRQVGNGA